MNSTPRSFSTLIASALALTALLVVGVAGSFAAEENPNPTPAECEPGQPYNNNCPNVIKFDFPERSFLKGGKVDLVHLACNKSCNHVNYVAKHGRKVAVKGSTWFKANYEPTLEASLTEYAKKQLRDHDKLEVNARVCVHPPGPENFCKSAKVILRKK